MLLMAAMATALGRQMTLSLLDVKDGSGGKVRGPPARPS
jgi:hypothetical protein